jgi:short-subunit dehydrogenase
LNVYAAARKASDIENLNLIPGVEGLMMDVTKPEQIADAFKLISLRGLGLSGLVNNAGVIDLWPLAELKSSELKATFDVNLFGLHDVTKSMLSLLLESQGRIVNISSIAGFILEKWAGPYDMTKHALESYSKTLHDELLPHGVGVSVVEPGGFRSSFAKSTALVLAERMKNSGNAIMKEDIEQVVKFQRDEILEVETCPSPEPVAESVFDALTRNIPRFRFVVANGEKEFRWLMQQILDNMMDVNRSSEFTVDREALHSLIDKVWEDHQTS